MWGGSPDIVIDLSLSSSNFFIQARFQGYREKRKKLEKKMVKDIRTGHREKSTESDPILREVDQYPEGDEATSFRIEASEKASSSSGEVLLTERQAWLRKLETSRFMAGRIEREITNNELNEKILKAGGMLLFHPYFIRTLDFIEFVPTQLTPNGWRILTLLKISTIGLASKNLLLKRFSICTS
ncbi:hypothetical protein TorRG33x02_280030 [Trema orientale]|uniref:Uncharacterized protein n=1 Tax=Trema orientale TaxID=63057 RepID=A0A2P5CMF1_TREOI|nr:hypothetical protein TorRG33x02_280030 [Trema orientale]